jgi:hypothetical protein
MTTKKEIESTENKCWVTISLTLNLGNYESIKLESGYSRTICIGEEPTELIEEMQDEISEVIINKAKQCKKQLIKNSKNN